MFHADPHAGNLLYDRRDRRTGAAGLGAGRSVEPRAAPPVDASVLCGGVPKSGGCGCRRSRSSAKASDSGHGSRSDSRDGRPVHGRIAGGEIAEGGRCDGAAAGGRDGGSPFPSSLIMFSKVLFTLDGILDDIRGNGTTAEFTIAHYLCSAGYENRFRSACP